MGEGKLIVDLLGAKDLKAADTNGFSDPIVELRQTKLDKEGKPMEITKTSTGQKKTLNPVWEDESWSWGVNNIDLLGESESNVLYIEVYDKDFAGKKSLGLARFDLRMLWAGEAEDLWLPLEEKKNILKRKA